MRVLTADTLFAGVIKPAHTKIIHEPDLGLVCNGNADTKDSKILERINKIDRNQRAVIKTGAGSDFMDMAGNLSVVSCGWVVA